MGFKAPVTIFKLNFKDEYAGLEVAVKSVPTGDLMDLMKMAVTLGSSGKDVKATDMDAVSSLFSGFAGALVSWNLEDEQGVAIPATLAGVNSLEFQFVVMVIMVWVEAVAGVSSDLGKASNSGGTFQGAPIPMEPL